MFGLGRRSPIATLSPAEARTAAEAGTILLVDVREAGEWAGGHVPGAVHAPLSRLATDAASLPTDRPVVFYCLSGARSAQAVSLCRRLGLAHDTHMAGGFGLWRHQGFPVTR
ncbi:rhodanese-like domain-containing protein [Mongoliimonas terrestris]|uniref:rhodanese-like domain-containing protein n=1 Tax=Mongoliimonas terrestris TaxID=1709001 RepID=UPI0009495539|nr:rhodanese-like domain-containing protein [Mongoliimonas terrestris]